MLATFISIALFALPALADFSVKTPKSIQSCKPIQIEWSGAEGAVDLVIVASKEPCGDILADLGGGHKQQSMTWQNPVFSDSMDGQNVSLSLQDDADNEAWSTSIPYIKGDTSCMNTTSTPGDATVSIPADAAEATPPSTPSSSSGGGAVAAGAANVGDNPLLGGALTSRQTSSSVFVISALAALLAFSL